MKDWCVRRSPVHRQGRNKVRWSSCITCILFAQDTIWLGWISAGAGSIFVHKHSSEPAIVAIQIELAITFGPKQRKTSRRDGDWTINACTWPREISTKKISHGVTEDYNAPRNRYTRRSDERASDRADPKNFSAQKLCHETNNPASFNVAVNPPPRVKFMDTKIHVRLIIIFFIAHLPHFAICLFLFCTIWNCRSPLDPDTKTPGNVRSWVDIFEKSYT